jgi:SAM-dependent methyltransferase
MPALYDLMGSSYARSRRADAAIAQALADQLSLTPFGAYLDLGCGTGNYTVALSAIGGVWRGVDVSEVMLAQARQKSRTIDWIQSNADALPFPDAVFQGAVCTLAIHHFPDLESPFREVRRTMQGGAFVMFTGLAEQMRCYWLCHYFPEMMNRSIERMPSESTLRAALSRAGFGSVTVTPFFVTDELEDLFLYSGKHRPNLYLDPGVRANISSFANLTSSAELHDGLARLSADLQSGVFASVKAHYAKGDGDYVYVTAHANS